MATKLRSGPVLPSGSRSDHRHPRRSQPGRQGVDLPKSVHSGETNKQAAGLDTRSALSLEIAAIAAKRGGNRTDVDDRRLRELECQRSLYLDADGRPTVPEAALRAMIEASARKTKQGPLVREGLMIESVTFRYNVDRYGKDVNELSKTAQFVAPVVVARQRILRTRVRFECPWSVVGVADVDPEHVDRHKLTAWLATGGRRVGLGDWRPEKSGHYGRFDVEKVIELPDAPGGRRPAV